MKLLINILKYASAKSNSTFLNQLTGKIGEVTSADTFHEALVHIFDQNDNMLCNGVLTRKGTVIAVKEGLREVLEPKIQIPGRSRKMIINFRIDYKYIAEMKVSIPNKKARQFLKLKSTLLRIFLFNSKTNKITLIITFYP